MSVKCGCVGEISSSIGFHPFRNRGLAHTVENWRIQLIDLNETQSPTPTSIGPLSSKHRPQSDIRAECDKSIFGGKLLMKPDCCQTMTNEDMWWVNILKRKKLSFYSWCHWPNGRLKLIPKIMWPRHYHCNFYYMQEQIMYCIGT